MPETTHNQRKKDARLMTAIANKRIMRSLTPRLTGARGRRPAGTNTGHQNREAMASVGVRVEPRVSLWREGKVGCGALA